MQKTFPEAELSSDATSFTPATADSDRGREDTDLALSPAPIDARVGRARKRDGKVVGRSALWYSIYKKSRRSLKKAGLYYVGFAEDHPTLQTAPHLADWVQVRHYQCRYFAQQLCERGRIPTPVLESCMYEIESVLGWALAHPALIKGRDMGNAWLWVALEVQQHMSMHLNTPFVFEDSDTVARWSLESLNEDMRRAPRADSKFVNGEQRMGVEAEQYDKRAPADLAAAAAQFNLMLQRAAPAVEFNAIRAAAKSRAEALEEAEPPWLYERVVEAKKALRKQKGLFGEMILVDVC